MALLHAHRFAGTLGQPFAGDAVYSNLAGTVPTLVNAGDGETGLQFAGGAQGLVVAAIPSTTGRLVYDVVVEFSAASTAPVEIVQLRGAAKVASLNRTSDGRLQLSNATATGAGLASTVAQAPVGTKFRVVLDANNGSGNYVATVYATDDPGATVLATLTVPQAATAITSVRLGYSGAGGTGTYRASWPVLATTPGEVGARNYGGVVAPPAAGYLLDWNFAGTNGVEFTSDARFTHLAGAKPTIVRAVEAKGLRFVGGTEGIVEHLFDPAPDPAVSLKVDTVWRLSERVTATAVVGQLRAGAARGPEWAFTDTNQLRLIRLSGTTAVPVATTTVELPVGDLFRIQLVEDDATLTLHLFADDTSTDPIATLTSTSSTPIAATALRLGVITKTGLGAALVDVFRPRAATALTPGLPTYPALPAEPPQVRAVTPTPAEPWSDVDLVATPIAGSSPIESTVWTPGAGSPPLKPGAGAARTVSARAAMRTKTYPYTVTTTAVDGQTATASIGMVVLPATAGIPQAGAVLVDDDLVTPMREALADESLILEPEVGDLEIVVSNLQASAPTTTGRVITFQTNAGVAVTRIMEDQSEAATQWRTHSITERTGSHTAGFTGQTTDTQYETRITLSAPGHATKVLTSAEYPVLAYRTAAVVVSPPTGGGTPGAGTKLKHRPPTLVDPLTIEVPVAGGSYKGLNGRDVRWIMPQAPVQGTVSIYGGGHHSIIGGETLSKTGGMSFDIEEFAGTVYVEGTRVDPTGVGATTPYPANAAPEGRPAGQPPFYSDGFRLNSRQPGSRVIMQRVWGRVDGFAKYADGTNGPHGDFIQLYRGPSRMDVYDVTVETYYQGFFLLAAQYSGAPAFGPYTFEDINVWRHTSSGGAGAWTLSGPSADLVTVKNCHARRDPGSNTNLVGGPGTSEAGWTVSTEAPPGGDFCPRSSVGVGYVSAGYV